jgi:glycosyltransferase involved in cell wall biosynthesis
LISPKYFHRRARHASGDGTLNGRTSVIVMPSIAILLCTYNGAQFLPAQLESLAAQSFTNWRLFVSDDGSSDDTLAIVSDHKNRLGSAPVDVRNGPRQGFVKNFLSLACDPALSFDYYAYCDQDDVWEPDKLARAVERLSSRPAHVPAMYCSRTMLIDDEGHTLGYSRAYRRKPSFHNALVQSIASGNTIVFNEAARKLLMICGSVSTIPSHDWWTYLLTSGAGGEVCYDQMPQVRYRMHGENVIGTNTGLRNRIRRLYMLSRGRFQRWSDMNVAALEPFRPHMTPENRALFDLFRASRQRGFFGRQIGFLNSGVYRQTFLDNLGLIVAVWARKI